MRTLTVGLLAVAMGWGQNSPASGWTCPSSADYRAAVDGKTAHGGRNSLLLESTGQRAASYSARQTIQANVFRGKRIRYTGWLKPAASADGTSLWLRIDMENGDYVMDSLLGLSAENAAEAQKSGWTRQTIVADVPADAVGISFGVRLQGQGKVWADDFAIDVVPRTVPTSTIERRHLRGAEKDKAEAVKRLRDEYAKAPVRPVNMGIEN